MTLLDEARLTLRVSDATFDPEIVGLISAALTDMRRVGVREDLLDPDSLSPLPRQAVMLYCRANFGYDNPESARFTESYQQTVRDLLNSASNESSGESDRSGSVSGYASMVADSLSKMAEAGQ